MKIDFPPTQHFYFRKWDVKWENETYTIYISEKTVEQKRKFKEEDKSEKKNKSSGKL